MREGNYSKLPERNPITHAVHKREVFWQIIFPIVIGALILLTLAIGSWFVSYNTTSQAANISVIWLFIPLLFFTLFFTFLLAGLAYGLIRLIGILPPYAAVVQNFFILVNLRVRHALDLAAEPVMKAASAQAMLSALLGRRTSKRS
jgi:hypothetical protein